MTHGVMVTQQILVLSFKVRVLVGQQKERLIEALFLLTHFREVLNRDQCKKQVEREKIRRKV